MAPKARHTRVKKCLKLIKAKKRRMGKRKRNRLLVICIIAVLGIHKQHL
jgi:hypothetical protein